MGCCFSKRSSPSPPLPAPNPISIDVSHVKHVVEKKEKEEKEKEVVVVAQSQQGFEVKEQVVTTVEKKKAEPVVVVVEEKRPLPLRTSSCTKEEVDAILIQCGRLSRSSSGKTSNEIGGGGRKYSGSKRSYDFDEERRKGGGREEEEEEEEEKPVSRPSPRRRTPGRERSGSRERDKRVSRSPGRRSECPASGSSGGFNGGDRVKQPGKMVSVPPLEKGVVVFANKRSASPGSRCSMGNNGRTSNENAHSSQPQSLSRSSSKKAEQSPYRRNPMTEIDDNSLRRDQPGFRSKGMKLREGEEVVRKPIQAQTQRNGGDVSNCIKDCVRDQLMSCRGKEQQQEQRKEGVEEKGASNSIVEIPGTITRTRSSRRSSRDLDHNPMTYASLLLEDIQNYHQQNNTTAFSLPPCVSKACSILEAVADLNSSFSDNKSYIDGDQQSNNDNGNGKRVLLAREPFVESEIQVKDDLMEPSLHKYVTVRELGVELEPQESAGSNSFIGHTWSSPLEPNSVDSKDQSWSTSRSTNYKEVKEAEFSPVSYNCNNNNNSQSGKQQKTISDARERRSRGGSSNLSNASRKRELQSSGKVSARVSGLHSAANS
ncbi:uncharacterized protein At1g65710-like isoform X2 [Dioscorea cayenensis subsp. rotundata]|uniref:Uncharacterized protein At1g65710-like isoform X2 n=1 Tax=Dioscorea cayennensis subsp. rotundata TaxID=55577 RepID=A0AB40D6F6_DIOCR|nr:uncharacterized protein At1g65710-like isoform X2 [Dioscorea cayenensis subsp. rotundata]